MVGVEISAVTVGINTEVPAKLKYHTIKLYQSKMKEKGKAITPQKCTCIYHGAS